MHKTNAQINKAEIIIIYHHGINFVTLPKVKIRWWLYSRWKQTNTHAENLNKNYAYIRKHKPKIKEKGKRKETKDPPSSNLPPVVDIDNLDGCTLAHSKIGHPLQQIDPAVLREGAQAHRQYLHCLHLTEPRWIGWLQCFTFATYLPIMATLLWLRKVCIGLCKGYVGHHIILWGHGCTIPPFLHWWSSVITWQCRNSSIRWHIVL
jgi:hypothetical protein